MYLGILLVAVMVLSCKSKNQSKYLSDTPISGTIHISADESFRPVIEDQIQMYESSFPDAHIIAAYKPEADCLRDLFSDTATRLVIITRGLLPKEEKYLIDSLNYIPGAQPVASDAVAIIVNAASHDTLFTMQRLRDQLEGKVNRNQRIVFDGLNATSTVRFITDSVLKGGKFDTSVVKAASNTQAVIEYVAKTPDAVGLVGINWVGNPEIPTQVKMLQKIKIAYVRCELCKDTPYVKPMQQSILTHRYPLVRGLYYVIKENFEGLGTGFTSFLKFERGQLIFSRAYLGPVMDFDIRNVRVNQKIPED